MHQANAESVSPRHDLITETLEVGTFSLYSIL